MFRRVLKGVLESRTVCLTEQMGDKFAQKQSGTAAKSYTPAISDVVMIEQPLGAMPTENKVGLCLVCFY